MEAYFVYTEADSNYVDTVLAQSVAEAESMVAKNHPEAGAVYALAYSEL